MHCETQPLPSLKENMALVFEPMPELLLSSLGLTGSLS